MKARIFFLSLLLPACAAMAQEAKVREHMEAPAPAWVGGKIVMVVELLAPGYFSGSPDFDLPSVPGLLLFPPQGSPVLGSETIDGVAYTVQRHEILVFPRKAGDFTVPAFQIHFNVKHSALDKDSVAQNIATEPQHFTAVMPPGAENISTLISTRELKADEQWQPQPASAKTGDAFTRTIAWSAPDIPGMAFPPFPAGTIPGLGIYPKAPKVADHEERGTLLGNRTDTVVYVCEQPGHYVIPAAHLTWWNTDDRQLHHVDFPARTFDVALNPAFSSPAKKAHSFAAKFGKWALVACAVAALAAIFLAAWRKTAGFRRDMTDFLRPVHLAPLNPDNSKK